MKIEYLEAGSPDCPLIRIVAGDHDALLSLQRAFVQLAEGAVAEMAVNDLECVDTGHDCRLVAKVSQRDRGVVQVQKGVFDWFLTPGSWDNVAGLVEPFATDNGQQGSQWLQQMGDIRVLVSTTGNW